MASECPVCHRPIPFWRVIRTTAWGSWHCPDCDSKLGIDRRRRFLAIIPWAIIVFGVLYMATIFHYGMFFALGLLSVFFIIIFYLFERATVLERAGFRCRECGYDLQGQVQPLCPECGYTLSEEEGALLQRIRGGEAIAAGELRQHIKKRWNWGGFLILLVAGGLLVGTFGGLLVAVNANRKNTVAPETQMLVMSVLNFVKAHNGDEPTHALQHVKEDVLTTSVLKLPDTMTDFAKIALGPRGLNEFDGLADAEQEAFIEEVMGALPEGVIAHRVGDFVFTYHGIDLPVANMGGGDAKDLWLVIGVPDPDQNTLPTSPQQTMISVGLADGTVVQGNWSGFMMALQKQNALRAKHGLPPLPDPRTVTHGTPAVDGN